MVLDAGHIALCGMFLHKEEGTAGCLSICRPYRTRVQVEELFISFTFKFIDPAAADRIRCEARLPHSRRSTSRCSQPCSHSAYKHTILVGIHMHGNVSFMIIYGKRNIKDDI